MSDVNIATAEGFADDSEIEDEGIELLAMHRA
jgi:hypothetical protein